MIGWYIKINTQIGHADTLCNYIIKNIQSQTDMSFPDKIHSFLNFSIIKLKLCSRKIISMK